MILVDQVVAIASAVFLVVFGTIVRMLMSKLQKVEAKVDDTLSGEAIRLLVDQRIDEKQVMLDYRLRELTKSVDKLILRLEQNK